MKNKIFVGLVFGFLFYANISSAQVHSWQKEVGGWRITEKLQSTIAPSEGDDGCPTGSVRVKGYMKLDDPKQGSVEALQTLACDKFLGPFDVNGKPKWPERCLTFNENKWKQIAATLPTKYVDVCVNQFEYPNMPGEYPTIFINYFEAQELCFQRGERLCTEEEWTFACEGEDATPYPYGYVRNDEFCNIDHIWRQYNDGKFLAGGHETMLELDRLWQGEASGMRPECKSSFGVYDMTGNVDEWATSSRKRPFIDVMKGGYWGPVRTRCRPATTIHGPDLEFYQQGFRCCSNPNKKKIYGLMF